MDKGKLLKQIIGIDLGTTNSCMSIIKDGRPIVIPTPDGNVTPSVVCFENKHIVVGKGAKNQVYTNPNTVLSVKTMMGTDKKIVFEDKEYAPEQISAFILQKLKKHASEYLGYEINDAVITVPAYFNELQREATRNAGEIAGFNVCQIINEPTSAALIYGLNKKLSENILVYDLGGGTFDVSLLRVENQNIKVIATSGNNHLGGDDFDKQIMNFCIDKFVEEHNVSIVDDKLAMQRLKEAAENAKISLSSSFETSIKLPFIGASNENEPLHIDYKLTRASFEEMTKSLVAETIKLVNQVFNEARFNPKKVDRILLVGGSTKMPIIFDTIANKLKKKPIRSINTDEVVALGAAVQGAILNNEIENVKIEDVISLTLSIAQNNGLCHPIIKRNTPIPTESFDIFTTANPDQTTVNVNVVQGERKEASWNKKIANFNFSGLKPATNGLAPQIRVSFFIDVSGLLHIDARDSYTSQKYEISVKDKLGLSRKEINRMIEDAEKHWNDDKIFIENINLKNRFQSLVYTMNQLIDDLKKEEKLDMIDSNSHENIHNFIAKSTDAIKTNNYDVICESEHELAKNMNILLKCRSLM